MKGLLKYPEDIEKIERVLNRLDYSAALTVDANEHIVVKACEEAVKFNFSAVAVFPTWICIVAKQLENSQTNPQLPVGFPSGGACTEVKKLEAEIGLQNGAKEIDMVMDIGRFKNKEYRYVQKQVEVIVKAGKAHKVGVKLIIETGYLDDQEKKTAARIAVDSGAEYVKTCTGFGTGRATIHDIILLKEAVGDSIKIKASGGILTLEDAYVFLSHGADRIAGRYSIVEQLISIGFIVK